MMVVDAHIAKWQTIQSSIVAQRAWKRKASNKRSAPDSFLFVLSIDDCLLTHGLVLQLLLCLALFLCIN
jgi:hypothetical protein